MIFPYSPYGLVFKSAYSFNLCNYVNDLLPNFINPFYEKSFVTHFSSKSYLK